jgi:hypothetical protein
MNDVKKKDRKVLKKDEEMKDAKEDYWNEIRKKERQEENRKTPIILYCRFFLSCNITGIRVQ